jgi:hypothetical protein
LYCYSYQFKEQHASSKQKKFPKQLIESAIPIVTATQAIFALQKGHTRISACRVRYVSVTVIVSIKSVLGIAYRATAHLALRTLNVMLKKVSFALCGPNPPIGCLLLTRTTQM